MRKAFLAALASGLLGTSLAHADSLPAVVPAEPAAKTAEKIVSSGEPNAELSCQPICCEPSQRLWVSADYLLWWVKNGPLGVPLVTTGSLADAAPGALGQPGTRVLFGNNSIDYGTFSGMRIGAGIPIGERLGFEASYFLLESRTGGFSASSDAAGNPIFGRPVFVVNDALGLSGEAFYPVANPSAALGGPFAGRTDIVSRSRLQGWEATFAYNMSQAAGSRFDLLAGTRILDLHESLEINDTLTPLSGATALSFGGAPVAGGSVVTVSDQFRATNHFYGGQLGLRGVWDRGPLSLSLAAKVALGSTEQIVRVNGATSLTPAGGTTTTLPGGLLAVGSNSGRFTRDVFGVVPEALLNVGWNVTQNVKLNVGYSFLYWNDVVRPGRQIDRTVNPAQVPLDADFGSGGGPARPTTRFNNSDFWAQGINFGVEFRY